MNKLAITLFALVSVLAVACGGSQPPAESAPASDPAAAPAGDPAAAPAGDPAAAPAGGSDPAAAGGAGTGATPAPQK